ncbi:alpha/beta hydrolase-fold protein [Pelomonas sp. SE-A7]|uniref:alpha/beta hydrolase n=1 Tax=Pelomonas sp. SE-A7 TaxID=3054953 RepID=UPI00259CDD42|nr:alpha/beta hydrolase-fold protein [Pelomonas sp. SE-A7]MDM4766313.1 alpha/beta hydrolase-fold protein [Pelomonas sp. SE-A7]
MNEVAAQLRQQLPGMSEQDAERFAASLLKPGPYTALQAREDLPRGLLTAGICPPGQVYPGVPHRYQRYQSAGSHPAYALLVFLDGERYLGPEANAAAVLDQLGLPCVALFVEPGAEGPGLPIYGGPGNRSIEYDSPGGDYARFLIEELIPHALEGIALGPDRAIVGLSSGGHCALNAAWERPDFFNLVASHCGSFVNIRGGHGLASQIRRDGTRTLNKVLLQTGEHDLDIVFGHWPSANRDMAAALSYRGIPHRLVVGEGGHSLAHGGALLPATLRWLFEP